MSHQTSSTGHVPVTHTSCQLGIKVAFELDTNVLTSQLGVSCQGGADLGRAADSQNLEAAIAGG
jgi:hypothetical protein